MARTINYDHARLVVRRHEYRKESTVGSSLDRQAEEFYRVFSELDDLVSTEPDLGELLDEEWDLSLYSLLKF